MEAFELLFQGFITLMTVQKLALMMVGLILGVFVGVLPGLGGPNGVADDTECVADWDRNNLLTPADVASFVSTWFFSVQNPGNLDADIDCNGQAVPADVAYFVQKWLSALQNPGTLGCAP